MTPAKAKLHRLVDSLPEDVVPAAVGALERLREYGDEDPLLQALLSAPEDDEPVTSEDEEAIREVREQAKLGEVRALDDVLRETG